MLRRRTAHADTASSEHARSGYSSGRVAALEHRDQSERPDTRLHLPNAKIQSALLQKRARAPSMSKSKSTSLLITVPIEADIDTLKFCCLIAERCPRWPSHLVCPGMARSDFRRVVSQILTLAPSLHGVRKTNMFLKQGGRMARNLDSVA